MTTNLYRAKIHHNTRKTHREVEPTVLLTDIYKDGEFFRDHMWTPKKGLINFIPKNNKYSIEVTFTAKEREYCTIRDFKQVTQISLVKINNVKKVKNGK